MQCALPEGDVASEGIQARQTKNRVGLCPAARVVIDGEAVAGTAITDDTRNGSERICVATGNRDAAVSAEGDSTTDVDGTGSVSEEQPHGGTITARAQRNSAVLFDQIIGPQSAAGVVHIELTNGPCRIVKRASSGQCRRIDSLECHFAEAAEGDVVACNRRAGKRAESNRALVDEKIARPSVRCIAQGQVSTECISARERQIT